MTSEQRKIAFVALGKEIQASLNPNTPQDELNVRQVQLRTIIERIHTNNGWFTEENVKNVLLNISSMLAEEAMNEWISNYDLPDNDEESLLTVGVVMAIMITDECINCGACEPECPNNAIYEGGTEWRFSDGTSLKGAVTAPSGSYEADKSQEPVSMDVYYIVSDKCTECVGFHDEPQCAAVCPVDCCVDDPDHRETEEQLLAKKEYMHV